jgi:hypothetical protein
VRGLFRRGSLAVGVRHVSARKIGLASIAACLILISVATSASADNPTVSISPTHGLPGTAIVMRGSGFAADAIVRVTFGSGNSGGTSAATDATGAFTDYMAAPQVAPGDYVVTASDGKDKASANFTIDGSTSTTTNSTTSSSTSSAKTTTVTTTVTATITTTAMTTLTTTSTATSLSTSTVTRPALTVTSTSTLTSTSTKNYTTTEPAAPITATATLTQLAAAETVTVSVSKSSADPPAAQSGPQAFGVPDTLLYFLGGVGIMVTAISVGMLAFRERTIEDYRSEGKSRGSST